jgi:hypothetical protein
MYIKRFFILWTETRDSSLWGTDVASSKLKRLYWSVRGSISKSYWADERWEPE